MHLIYGLSSVGFKMIEVDEFTSPFPVVTIKDKQLYQELIIEKNPIEIYHTKVIDKMLELNNYGIKFSEEEWDLLSDELNQEADEFYDDLENIAENIDVMDDLDLYQFTVYFIANNITYKYIQEGYQFPDYSELQIRCEEEIAMAKLEQKIRAEKEEYNLIAGTVYNDGTYKQLKNEISRKEYARDFYRRYYSDFFKHSTISLKELENYVIYLCSRSR